MQGLGGSNCRFAASVYTHDDKLEQGSNRDNYGVDADGDVDAGEFEDGRIMPTAMMKRRMEANTDDYCNKPHTSKYWWFCRFRHRK